VTSEFLQCSFADHIRSLISYNRTHDYNVPPYLDSMGTTHVSVLAEDGSAVAVTSTINYRFGSGVYSSSTGIILNNELSDFCGRTVNISPGEQPPSSMAPAVLKSDSEILVIGASGGSRITSALASVSGHAHSHQDVFFLLQALINHLWFGKSLKEAIATPLVFVDSENSLIKTLAGLGHQLKQVDISYHSSVNAVEKKGGWFCAVSDYRKRGEAAGY
uniref:Gamma-glutamyltransferase 5-like n=1 Tax=Fundulus heteroclitus TaxID=8078 RepID=A0A3Q2Q9X4_FUNHE